MDTKTNLYTIKELNNVAKREGLSKVFQSYASIYNLVRSGNVRATKAGNRYLLRICDIENALLVNTASVYDGIRKIN